MRPSLEPLIRVVASARLGGAALCLLLSLPATAELAPTPLVGDARLVTFDFDPDNTYLVLSKPKAVTHLEFPEGERIQTLAAGDTVNWELTPTASRRHIFIKPKVDNVATTMTVLTEKRSYQFVLRAMADGAKWYQRVTWRLPQTLTLDQSEGAEEMPRGQRSGASVQGVASTDGAAPIATPIATPIAAPIAAERLNFSYTLTGEAAFRPLTVFDDGRFTWIKLPPGLQELPVVFALDGDGDYVLVNYLPKGDTLLVQRVMERFVLRLGKAEVRIQRKKASTPWFGGAGD